MAQMEVYEVLKNRYLSGDYSYMGLLCMSDKIIVGIKKGIYCGSFDVGVLDKDAKRLCALGLVQKKHIDGRVCYRLNKRAIEDS